MTSDFIPKKPHKKSRAGCQTCKSRKIKCDEVQPKCSFCEKRKLTCVYTPRSSKSTTSPLKAPSTDPSALSYTAPAHDRFKDGLSLRFVRSPEAPVLTAGSALSSTDLRMMHHYFTITAPALAVGEAGNAVMQFSIPTLAFEHDYLLNAILGVASLHTERLVPGSTEIQTQTDIYRAKALSSFRKAITRINPKTTNFEAALIMSIVITVLCVKDSNPQEGDLIVVKWMILYCGIRTIVDLDPDDAVGALSISPIFKRELVPLTLKPSVPRILVDLIRSIQPPDPDFQYVKSYCKLLDALGILYASLQQDGVTPSLFIRTVTWPSYGTQDFADLARAGRPRALIILAYYLLFVKFVKGLWWTEGIAEREIQAIVVMVGPEWSPYLEVPVAALTMDDDEEIARLMLR